MVDNHARGFAARERAGTAQHVIYVMEARVYFYLDLNAPISLWA
jgi:hypothetical protein